MEVKGSLTKIAAEGIQSELFHLRAVEAGLKFASADSFAYIVLLLFLLGF
jgi:hypothetical protein